jgi:hypothetical protein
MTFPAFGYSRLASAVLSSSLPNPSSGAITDVSKQAVRIKAATANAITHVRCSVYETGTSPVCQVSIQGVNSNGFPDGSIKAGGNAKGTFTPVGGTATITEVALTSSYTPSVGEALAIVFEFSSGVADFSNCGNVVLGYGGIASPSHHFATVSDFGFGGGYGTAGFVPGVLAKTATERYGGILLTNAGVSGFSMTTKETTTTGRRVAAKIVTPAAAYISALSISGFHMAIRVTAAQSIKAGIWNAAGTELKAVTIDTDYLISSQCVPVEFDSALSIAPGDTIYVGLESISSSSAKIDVFDFDNTTDRDAAGSITSGSSVIYSLWDGSAWTDSALDVPLVSLNVSSVTGATSGGGLKLIGPGGLIG